MDTKNSEDFNTEKSLLNIQKLSQTEFSNKPKNILILGPRASGKTELIKYIISLLQHQTKFYLFTSQPESYNVKGDVLTEINEVYLNKIIENNTNHKVCVIFDDVFINSINNFEKYVLNSKFHNITNIISLQYDSLIPSIRTNINLSMFFYDNNISNKKKYYDKYFGIIPTFKLYNEIFNMVTQKYGLICLTNYGKNKIYNFSFNILQNDFQFETENLTLNQENKIIEKEKLSISDKKEMINKIIEQNDKLIELIKNL